MTNVTNLKPKPINSLRAWKSDNLLLLKKSRHNLIGIPIIFNTVCQTVWIRIRHRMDTSYYLTSICPVRKIDTCF